MSVCVLSVGTNLGDRLENIEGAFLAISKAFKLLFVSEIYETKPIGYANQGDFLNAACAIETDLKPFEILNITQKIENDFARIRTIKNGPRTLDLDIILYDDISFKTENLEIPHPRFKERDFVISPLLDLQDNGIFNSDKFANLQNFLKDKTRKFKIYSK